MEKKKRQKWGRGVEGEEAGSRNLNLSVRSSFLSFFFFLLSFFLLLVLKLIDLLFFQLLMFKANIKKKKKKFNKEDIAHRVPVLYIAYQ